MSPEDEEFIKSFDKTVDQAFVFASIVRDSELQREQCVVLEHLIERIEFQKEKAISEENENYSNLLLGCVNVAKGILSELRMWLALKEDEPDGAWDYLIDAQSYFVGAIRAHETFGHIALQCRRLATIEKVVFPPQMFVSSGLVVHIQECSICGNEYEDCPHLIGKPYMGKFCQVIAKDVQFDHVAIVEVPADKHCRITAFSDNNINRNRMTWLPEPGGSESESPKREDSV